MAEADRKLTPWARRLPLIAIGATLFFTYHALVVWPDASVRSGFDAPFSQRWEAIALTTLLLSMSVVTVATILALALRVETRTTFGDRLEVIVYAFSIVPAVYGVVVSMFTGRASLYLPFGAFALFAIGAAYASLRAPHRKGH